MSEETAPRKHRYTIDPSQRIEVTINIECNNERPRVITNRCIFTQGTNPCKGDLTKPCGQKFETCNTPMKEVACTDDWGKLQAKGDKKAIEGIFEEKSSWALETWAVAQKIESESYRIGMRDAREFDFSMYARARIKYLLKKWTLSSDDPELKLAHQTVPGTEFTVLTEPCLNKILGSVDRKIIDGFYRGYDNAVSARGAPGNFTTGA
jgi:hypothetical protein